ncbi:hypothetical protein B0T25DRAFT_298096 [Lasiosphaeria hispida]|uniref:Uncharacterized protein n=1 Tax=Lasiosphaeria hispida TaxID=260671 RepID=A0AAJ0MBF4_9PEZI|nr:hypothetical protein B0T25DRAFT_298096 [Lasiosphaeria hispida]
MWLSPSNFVGMRLSYVLLAFCWGCCPHFVLCFGTISPLPRSRQSDRATRLKRAAAWWGVGEWQVMGRARGNCRVGMRGVFSSLDLGRRQSLAGLGLTRGERSTLSSLARKSLKRVECPEALAAGRLPASAVAPQPHGWLSCMSPQRTNDKDVLVWRL